MRRNVTALKLQQFMEELARRGRSPGNVFFTGGATASCFRMREQTIDVDSFEGKLKAFLEGL